MGTEQGLCLGVTGKLVKMKGMLGTSPGRHCHGPMGAAEPMQSCSRAGTSGPGAGMS